MTKSARLVVGLMLLVFVVGAGVTHAQSGLVAHWKLDETSGVTAADSSGYGNSGSVMNGPTWVAGRVGGAVQLTGGSQHIVADNVAINATAGGCNTVAFWMKWDGVENQMPFGWNAGYDLWFYGGAFGINTAQSDILGIPSSGLAGQWVHVAVVFPNGVPSPANTKIYINGAAQTVAQRLSSCVDRTATTRVFISGWGNDGSYKFSGAIDDMRIYNRELSAAEVAGLAVANGATIQLSQNGVALVPIVIAASASDRTKTAAGELKQYLDRMSGASFAIQTNGSTGLILGTLSEFPVPELSNALAIAHGIDGKEAFAIRTESSRVLLLGATDKGASHAAYRFLEELGCRWFFPSTNWEVIPVQPSLQFGANITERPVFLERRIWYAWGFFYDSGHPGSTPEHPRNATTDYADWSRRNRMDGSFVSDCGHAYERIAAENAAEFAAHPEYWALVNGVRQGPQFELANPGLRQLVVNWAIKYFQDHPTADMVSVDPADGGGVSQSPESQALGTPSENAFGMANEVARALQVAFPGQNKMVGMYAYNWHSDPPSFPLEPNVYIQLTMGFNGGLLTLDELFEEWPKKCTNLGFYDYYSTWRWDYDRWPGGRVASKYYPIGMIRRFQEANARSGAYATSISAESGDNWGLHGRSYYLANKLMWNPNSDAEVILQDYYDKAFGPAATAMKTYFGYQDNTPPICPGVYGALFRAVQDASVAASGRPDVQLRLDDIKNYLNFEYLNQRLGSAPDQATRDAITLRIWTDVYRARYSYMNHWEAIRQDWIHEDSLPAGTLRPWRVETPISHAETEALFQEGLAYFPALVVPTEVPFSTNLVAVDFGGEPVPTSQFYQEGSTYEVISFRGEPLRLKIAAGSTYGYPQRYQVTDLAGHVLQEGVPQPNQVLELEVPVPRPGLYYFSYNDHGEYGEVFWKADQVVALPLRKDASYRAMRPVSQMFFYVPKGTTNVNYYYRRAPWQYGGAHQVIDPNGTVVKDVNVDGDYVSFPVAAGLDGKVWKIGGPYFGLGLFYFFEVPNYFSPMSARMLVPREVAERDSLTIITGAQPILPGTPGAAVASPVTSHEIDLSWTDNAAYETGFKIERKTGSGGTYAQIATVGMNVTQYRDSGLTEGTVYFYRVRATNADGDSGYSNEVSAAPSNGRWVAHWRLDETSGTAAADSSGYGNTATLVNGPTWVSGRVGGAVELAAGSQYLVADNVAINATAGGCNTVAFWMKWSGVEDQMPFGWNGGYDLYFGNGSFGINTAQGDILGIASAGLTGQWVHVAVVFPNGVPTVANAKMYINGSLRAISQRQGGCASRSATSRVFISGWGYDSNYKFGGAIDEVRIFDRELSAAEVAALVPGGTGSISRDVWTGIGGISIAAIPLGVTPAITDTLTSFEAPTDWADSYGTRIRGYITAPVSGSYIFWIASDDNGELWLSSNDQPANKVLIASVSSWTPSRAWSTAASQKSAAITLVAGQRYYVEAWQKEGGGGDNLAVGWSKPGESTTAPSEVIPGNLLSPWSGSSVPSAPSAPNGLTANAVSGSQINLGWTDTANNDNGFKIERKTGSGGTYAQVGTVGPNVVTYQDTGLSAGVTYYYRVRATNEGGDSGFSNEANATTPVQTGLGSISREVWTGLSASYSISDIPVTTTPNIGDTLTSLEGPSNWADNYGTRIRGYITAPVSGSYVFWVATDDAGELWLSTNDQPANKMRIAYIDGWAAVREWNRYATQKSAAINLVAGQRYYVEVLQKEVGGGDNVAVGWAKPGEATTVPSEVVPGSCLSPWVDSALLADSTADFSSTQGQGNWYYGYYDKPSAATFIQDSWDSGSAFWRGPEDWCLVANNFVHPGGGGDWTVRRWVAEVSGAIHIAGTLAKTDLNGGDGVIGHILVNGVEQWSQVIAYNDGVGVNYTLDLTVTAGDAIDFAVDPVANYYNDSTKFSAIISGSQQSLASPWSAQDIGTVGAAGSAGYIGGVYTINGSGADIWNTADGFQYVYQMASGDCDIRARVTAVSNTNPWAKAGVMVRDNLNANAMFADMVMTPGNGASFQYRASTGGNCGYSQSSGLTVPYWVRLTRTGNVFTGYMSSDGSTWTQVGSSVTIAMGTATYIGLPVTAHNNSALCTATFSNVTVVP